MPRTSLQDWSEEIRSQPPKVDLLEGLLVDTTGISMLGGPPGRGKTNLLLQLAFCLSTGVDFIGMKTPNPVVVSYATFEGSEQKLLKRLDKLSPNFNAALFNDNFFFERNSSMWINTYFKELVNIGAGSKLFILDPLKDLCFGDPNKTDIAHQVLQLLKKLSEETGAHILLGHHVTKPRNEGDLLHPGDMFRLKGSGEYADQAETVLMLERTSQARNNKGKFQSVRDDNVTLYLAKVRDAEEDTEHIDLHFNRKTLMHELALPEV